MKELQSIVNKHFDKLRHKKKYLAMVTALSMLVSFMVPLILTEPADSMTFKKVTLLADEETTKIPVKDLSGNISGKNENMIPNAAGTSGNIANGVTYTPAQMDVLALLFGGTVGEDGVLKLQDIYEGCTTVEEALEVDKETYFLGFASDFCAFIEGDFTATDADAEGRVAVGGNLRFDWDSRKWNYQIGSGDYEVMSPLDEVKWSDDYKNVYGFASALVGGQMFRINTLSTGNSANNKENDRHINGKGDTAYYDPDDGLYKYFLVSNTDGFLHYDEPNDVDVPYDTNCSHDYPGSCAYCSSESGNHAYLDDVNELSQMYIYDGIRDLIKDTFAYIRSRSDTLAHMQSIEGKAVYTYEGEFEKVLFDAAGVPENTKTVYFTIDDWKDEYMKIEFVNIPEGANIVVNCKESGTVKIASDGNGGRKGDVVTSINGKIISKEQLNDQDYKDAGNANNHPDSARILYNFYNTPELHIDGCFNGTVLCPYADAYSKKEECTGHLSGALIAKSFYGGLEFGYRPYRGSSDIFGMSSGYEIPVDKLFAGTEDPLSGAMFEVLEIDDSIVGDNIISLFESANKTNIISLPTYIDYSGDTYYIAESVESDEEGLKEITNNKFFSENGVPLSSPLEVYAYKTGNYSDGDLIGNDDIPLQGNFYIKGTRVITLDGVTHETTPVYAYSNSGADRYEVYLSKIITASDSSVTVKVKDAAETEKSVTVNFIPMGINLTGNIPTEAGNPISFQLENYPTDGIQFKYYYSSDGIKYTEIQNMNGTSGSFTPKSEGIYTIKAQAWYNNKPIAEAVSQSVNVSAASNPYIVVSNESPYAGDTITVSVADKGNLNITQWQVSNGGNVNNGLLYLQNTGAYKITATLSDGSTVTKTITKTINVSEALVPKLWVSSNNAIAGKDTITFNVYDLPNGVTVKGWSFGNKSGAESSASFVPEELGNRPLYVDLSNGTRLEAWIQVDAPQADTSQMTLVATSDIGGTSSFYKGVKINFSVTGASSSNIQYRVFYNDVYDYTDGTSSITPVSAGKYTITATVDGVVVPNQVVINVPDYVLTISPSLSEVGKNVDLSVQNLPPTNVSHISYYIADGNYHIGDDNTPNDRFTFTALQAGIYTVKAVIHFQGGGTSEVTAQIQTNSATNNAAVSYATFSMRRGISVLANEATDINVVYDEGGNGKITIVADNEEFIGRVRLNTLYADYDYSIKAVMYAGETKMGEQIFTRDQIQGNLYWADIICDAANITRVEVEAVAGSVGIKDCHVTWLEPCQYVKKTYPANGKVSDTESYTITLEESVKPIENFMVKFVSDEENLGFVLEFFDGEGNKLSYNNESNGQQSVSNGIFDFANSSIVFDNNKSIADVAKIVISSKDKNEFKVGYYSVNSTVPRGDKVDIVPTDTVVEEHTYIIKEDTPPQGFVKTDKNYKVVIKETISLENGNIEDNRYPKVSNATITIYKSVERATFTEKSDYTKDEKYSKAFEAALKISNDYDQNIRTIEYDGITFVIDRNNNGEVTSFEVNGAASTLTDWSKPQEFKYNEKRFYYNPVTAMVVPFPNENLTYENAPGLHFQKVDDIGLPVKGADIQLQVKVDNEFVVNDHTQSIWSWSDKSVQTAIDASKLDPAYTYRFFEETPPDGYEASEPIYFKVVVLENGARVVRYAMDEAELDTEDKDRELDITEKRVIQMIDMRILGAELTLKKVKEGTETFIGEEGDYATFSLYADNGSQDGVLIKENIVVDSEGGINVELDGIEVDKPELLPYVENGYLKPGKYFLVETHVPDGYMSSGAISIRIDRNFNIILVNEKDMHITLEKEKLSWQQDNVDVWSHNVISPSGDVLKIEKPNEENPDGVIGIPNVVKVEVEADKNIFQYWFTKENGVDKGSDSHGKNTITVTYKEPILLDKVLIFAPKDTIFTKIEITTSDEEVYFYDANYVVETLDVVKIGNKVDTGFMDIEVQKRWEGDKPFASLRPEVIVNLYRTTTPIPDYNNANLNGELVQPITLNASNSWKHKFENLATYIDNDGTKTPYYYYIREVDAEGKEITLTGYNKPVYGVSTKGALTVTNTLDPVSINVKKHWSTESKGKPEKVVLRLQINLGVDEDGNEIWENVDEKIITISAETEWSGTIDGLLRGKQYRLIENSTVGWEPDLNNQEVITITTNTDSPITDVENDVANDTENTLDLTNMPKKPDEGSIQLNKDWNTTEDLPSSVYFKLYRVAKKFYPPQEVWEVQEDYARLLQYSLYFYDANMCGDDVGEKSALPWRDNCHEEDGTNAIAGGYHDAGDHVMFGLPQGYSATMLGWSLYEFNTTAPDGKKVYDNLNQTAHYKIISDRFNDFFAECIRVNEETGKTEILVQKGDGDIDHKLWGAPETQQDRTEEMIWSEAGADIAAEYAASLALSYLNFYRDDLPEAEKTKYRNHLAAAKKLYDFATTANREKYSNSFYPSGSDNDDKALAAGWLYLATVKEGSAVDRYKNECNVTSTNAITWDEVHIAAACVKAHIDNNWDSVADNYANVSAETGICYNTANTYYEGPHTWGTARHNALSQTVALAIAKNLKENNPTDARAQKIADWCKTQMNFILGGNTWKDGSPVCLVTGFSEISTKYAHHRAASGWDDHEAYKINPTYDSDGHIIIGALAGGPAFKGHDDQQQMKDYGHDNCVANHTYLDDLHDYCCNEVALDYNAGLVGAAAGLYYFFETGHTYEIPGVEVQYLQPEDEEVSVPANMFYALSLNLLKGTRVMADESMYTFVGQHDVVSGDYEHNKDYKRNVSSITGNNTIDLIEFVFDGAGSITGHIVPNNEWNSRYEPSNAPLVDNILSITTFPKNIVELWINNWGSNVNLVQIRFYTAKESGGGGNVTPSYTVTGAESMTVNATETFTVSGMSGNIKWTYQKDNGNIITITNNGGTSCQFIPTEAGSYVITATDSSGNSASATVTVTQQQQESFTLRIDNGEININAETYLRPDPSDNVSYSYIGNQDGLRIDNDGKVTGLKAGTYTITASRNNGSQTATTNLTVKEMSLNTPTTEITVGGNGTQWSINNPANNSSINWSSENTSVATVDGNGNITAVSAGDAVIKATVSYNGNNVTFQNTIKVTGNSSSGGTGGGSTSSQYILLDTIEKNKIPTDNEKIFPSLSYEDVVKIEIVFEEGKSGNGCNISVNDDWGDTWRNPTGNVIERMFDPPIDVNKIHINNISSGDIISKIYIYSKMPDPTISGAKKIVEGEELILTPMYFDGTDNITWSVTNTDGSSTNLAEIDQNGKLTATGGSGTVRVTATRTADGKTQSAYVDIEIDEFVLKFNTGEIYKEISLRKGKNTILDFNRNEDVTITWDAGYEQYLTVDGRNVTVKDVDGSQEIGFTATYNRYGGSTVEGKILIVGDLSISGESKTYTGRKLSLTANNAVGNVTWSIVDAGGTEATISQSGVLTAGGKAGTVKVQVTDDDNMTSEFEIVIQPGCAEVELEGLTDITYKFAEEGKTVIELTAADNWSKLISGLEVYDENRDYYCYYIVECDEYGNPIKSGSYVTGSNGAMFIPTSYNNNGATIEKNQTSVIEVSNALSGKVEGQMPSTGGDGTTTYYCFGAFIMLLSAAGFIGLRRRQRSQRSE